MNTTVYILILFWAFFTGFLLGITFPNLKLSPVIVKKQSEGISEDGFATINEQYRNFLSYDGSKQ